MFHFLRPQLLCLFTNNKPVVEKNAKIKIKKLLVPWKSQ